MVQIAVTNVKLGQKVVTVTVSAQPTSNLNRSRKRQYQYLVMQVKITGEEAAISKGSEMENTILDNELILFDRLNVIKDVYNKYDYEKNGYISFSGGKDSTIIHYLFDMAVPGNRVPRVYSNTGIEYNNVVDHVKKMQEKDDRIIILEPKKNIQKTLKENGYPFKSKEHSRIVGYYQSNREDINKRLNEIESDKKLLSEYEYIHNLPRGSKTVVKYIYGVRERERELYFFNTLP